MKTLNKALLEANKVDKLKFATLVAGLFSVLSLQAQTDAAAPSIADTLSSPATHLADTSSTQSQRSGSFVIDPSYSPTDKLITTRFAGGGSIHGIKV